MYGQAAENGRDTLTGGQGPWSEDYTNLRGLSFIHVEMTITLTAITPLTEGFAILLDRFPSSPFPYGDQQTGNQRADKSSCNRH